jgi:hypothetical protein
MVCDAAGPEEDRGLQRFAQGAEPERDASKGKSAVGSVYQGAAIEVVVTGLRSKLVPRPLPDPYTEEPR